MTNLLFRMDRHLWAEVGRQMVIETKGIQMGVSRQGSFKQISRCLGRLTRFRVLTAFKN